MHLPPGGTPGEGTAALGLSGYEWALQRGATGSPFSALCYELLNVLFDEYTIGVMSFALARAHGSAMVPR